MKDLLDSAVANYKSGRFRESEETCRAVLGQDPNCVPALLQLSYSVAAMSRKGEALSLTEQILAADPTNVEALVWRANLLRESGRAPDATIAAKSAVDVSPDFPTAHFALGLCHMASGRLDAAADCLGRAVTLKPESANYRYHLGLALDRLSRFPEAIPSYRAAADLAPKEPVYLVSLGQLFKRLGRIVEAIDCFRAALSLRQSAPGNLELADLYVRQGEYALAESCLRVGLELDPKLGAIHEMLGMILEESGRFEEAVESLKTAYGLQPGKTSLLYRIVRSKRITEADSGFVEGLEALRTGPRMADEQLRYLDYALGKAYDDLSRFKDAIRYFDEANVVSDRLQFGGKTYPVDQFHSSFEAIKRRFTRSFFQQNRELIGSDSDRPVFIVGMPRSGTTLVEQILSCHPDMAAGGELPFWLDAPAKNALHNLISSHPDKIDLDRLADRYLSTLKGIATTESRVIDKMPNNYMALGLVHLLFPNARIIHCRRNPVDNCLSIYMTLFSDPPKFAYRRVNIVAAYELYQDLVKHWIEAIPSDRLMTVDYEELVSNREAVTRSMVAFCGVTWDEACLHHEANSRTVKTPSLWQVRQPVYDTSVGRWKNYEPWLGDFRRLRNDD